MNESAISRVISVLFWPLLCLYLARMKLTRWPGWGLRNGNEPFHRAHGNLKISTRNFLFKARGQECAPEPVNTSCQYVFFTSWKTSNLCAWAFPFWVLVVYGGIDMTSSAKLNNPRSLINPPDGEERGRYSKKSYIRRVSPEVQPLTLLIIYIPLLTVKVSLKET